MLNKLLNIQMKMMMKKRRRKNHKLMIETKIIDLKPIIHKSNKQEISLNNYKMAKKIKIKNQINKNKFLIIKSSKIKKNPPSGKDSHNLIIMTKSYE